MCLGNIHGLFSRRQRRQRGKEVGEGTAVSRLPTGLHSCRRKLMWGKVTAQVEQPVLAKKTGRCPPPPAYVLPCSTPPRI